MESSAIITTYLDVGNFLPGPMSTSFLLLIKERSSTHLSVTMPSSKVTNLLQLLETNKPETKVYTY